MKLIRFMQPHDSGFVYINPEQVVRVRKDEMGRTTIDMEQGAQSVAETLEQAVEKLKAEE